jgi:hypothetical protein
MLAVTGKRLEMGYWYKGVRFSQPHMSKIDNQIRDKQKYFVETGDPGFSAERNKSIIERTIAKYEAMRAKKVKEHIEGVAERSDAIIAYMKSPKQVSTPLEKYFGRKVLAQLRGEQIRDEIDKLVVKNPFGKIIRH